MTNALYTDWQILGVTLGAGALIVGIFHAATYGFKPRRGRLWPDQQHEPFESMAAAEYPNKASSALTWAEHKGDHRLDSFARPATKGFSRGFMQEHQGTVVAFQSRNGGVQ